MSDRDTCHAALRGGVVVIGRNEGERLRRCLTSVVGRGSPVVYVDSGSTDGSVGVAKDLGAHVVELDMSHPFTAARARNAGFEHLRKLAEETNIVQFVDGDCEVDASWLEVARRFLAENRQVAVVFGRRRERFPERSIYNRLCDLEWNIAAGEARSCGGDAMIRADALLEVGGYRPDLIAGEEPELCVRLRKQGWKIFCLDHPMTLHDADMTHFAQWWRRSVRAGYAFAQVSCLHGGAPEYQWVNERRRAWIWGAGIPAAILAAAAAFGPAALLLALVYPAQVARLYGLRKGYMPIPLAASVFHVLGRFPEAVGQIRSERDLRFGHFRTIIEYK